MKKIFVTYSELRLTTNRMYSLVRSIVGKNESLNLKIAFYQDLEISGTDWDSFMEEYEKEFNCRLEGLNYEDYFIEEMSVKIFLLAPFRILTLPLLFLPKKSMIYRKTRETFYPIDKSKGRLTIGDLVLSAIAKRFIKREKVQIKVKYTR